MKHIIFLQRTFPVQTVEIEYNKTDFLQLYGPTVGIDLPTLTILTHLLCPLCC